MPSDQVVKLTFMKMDVEESPSNMTKCSFDYIEVRDGLSHKSPLIDRFCGTSVPATIIAASNQLVLEFYSDSREVRTGFKAKFESVNKLCGGFVNVTNETQTLQSLNYPNAYPSSLRCRWHFQNDYRRWYSQIRIIFNDLDVDCNNNDRIEFTANTYTSHRIEPFRMCGRKAPPAIVSKTGLWMTFITSSNPVVNHKGFSLNYTFAICNETYTDESGFIVNPSYPDYSYYNYCRMNITAKVGHTISLYFNDFRLDRRRSDIANNCPNGNMTVKDGIDSTSPVIAVLCGVAIPEPIFSTGNQLSIELRNHWYSSKFFISYTTTNAGRGCGGNLTSFNGTFTSPLYPMPYNQSGECKWFIHSLGLHSLTLRFTFFSLSSTIGCDSNYVEIYEGLEELPSNKVIRLCGDVCPLNLIRF
jgi:cubilin